MDKNIEVRKVREMKMYSSRFACAIFTLGWLLVSEKTLAVDMVRQNTLLPEPFQVTWGTGSLQVSSGFNVVLEGVKEARVKAAVKRFVQRLKRRTAIHVAQALQPHSPKPAFIINCQSVGLTVQTVREDESYDLAVTDKNATLSAPNPLGILHGLETLLQLVENHERMGSSIPYVTIHDQPRFAWRGLLIDVCRHFESLEVLERNLDAMAEAKMNVFHWHLSENQGFRVESKLFPKLQEMGSDGKFYTQAEVKKLIAYARDRGIRVVPEFDMPGHSTAWFVGYPEFASAPGPYQIERHFGVFDPAFDPT